MSSYWQLLQREADQWSYTSTERQVFVTWYSLRCDSAVGIATGHGRDDRGVGVRVPVGSSTPALGPIQPPIQQVPWGSLPQG
jgi:hypothetical protein